MHKYIILSAAISLLAKFNWPSDGDAIFRFLFFNISVSLIKYYMQLIKWAMLKCENKIIQFKALLRHPYIKR